MDRGLLKSIKTMQKKVGANGVRRVVSIKDRCRHVSHVLVMWLKQSPVSNISSQALLLQHIDDRIKCSEMLSIGWLIFFRPTAMASAVISSLKHPSLHTSSIAGAVHKRMSDDDPWASDNGGCSLPKLNNSLS
jgi:hypothetical protein